MPISYTERGFADYMEFTDTYDAQVTVRESSRAMIEGENEGPWVWVFVKGGQLSTNDGAAHLNPKQARQLVIGLQDFLSEIPAESEPEGRFAHVRKRLTPAFMAPILIVIVLAVIASVVLK